MVSSQAGRYLKATITNRSKPTRAPTSGSMSRSFARVWIFFAADDVGGDRPGHLVSADHSCGRVAPDTTFAGRHGIERIQALSISRWVACEQATSAQTDAEAEVRVPAVRRVRNARWRSVELARPVTRAARSRLREPGREADAGDAALVGCSVIGGLNRWAFHMNL